MSLFRRALTTAAIAAGLALLSPVSSTFAADLDCGNFKYQEDAQAVLNANPADPNHLDGNHNGIACESLPHRGSQGGTATSTPPATTTHSTKSATPGTTKKPVQGGQVKIKPVGAVATGGGEPESDGRDLLVAIGALTAAGVSGGMVLYLRRRPS
ncbi:MAG TPA: excalibur calcium-binding domain-containing protein [Amycolatopsis sp.]|nr:excalibur calcium-binding domain-containing protein [Amycolatopsis sp.]